MTMLLLHLILALLVSTSSAEPSSARSLLQRAGPSVPSKTATFEDALIEEAQVPSFSDPRLADKPTSTLTTTRLDFELVGGWKDKWVPNEFRQEVDGWATPDTCKVDVAYKSVSAAQRRTAEVSRETQKVSKVVKVNYTKVTTKEVPVPVNITQDKVVYYSESMPVNRYVVVDKIEKRNRTVEVPVIKEIIKNVTKPGSQVYREVQKRVIVNVSKPVVKETSVNVTVTQERLIFVNNTKKIKVNVTVPKIVKRYVEVDDIEIMEVNRTTGDADEVNVSSKERTMEVPNVTIKEKYVHVNITRQKIVHKVIKKKVQRQVEVPVLEVKKVKVEIPQYRETIREVPMVEIRQRTVTVEKEELELQNITEEVPITTEILRESIEYVKKNVTQQMEVADEKFETIDVPSGPLNIESLEETNIVHATESSNLTEEELEIQEEVEEIPKIVEVMVEREEIIQVPKYVTRNVTKRVELWTIREQIIEVPVAKTVDILMEVPKVVTKNRTVVLDHEEAAPVKNLSTVRLVTEEAAPEHISREVKAFHLIPQPYGVREHQEAVELGSNDSSWNGSNSSLSEEIIVQEYVEQEFQQEIQVPETTTLTRELRVPVYQVEENIVEVPRTVYEDEIIEVPKILEVVKLVEVEGNESEIFEREVLVPEYIEHEVETYVEVPNVVYAHRDIQVLNEDVEEEVVEHEKVFFQDEIVKVPKVVTVDKWVSSTASNATAAFDTVKYVNVDVVKEVEVLVPHYIEEEVEVPFYEIEEEIVEVKKPVVVEEIVEVPKIIDVERIVEVPTIEYNDTIVERVVKKTSQLKTQRPVPVTKQKDVSLKHEVLHIVENRTTVPLTAQSANFVPRKHNAKQVTKTDILNLTHESYHQKIKKVVKAKKRIEVLVPKYVENVTKKFVEVIKELIVENVVPIYKERVVQKHVEVPVYTVNKQVVEKELVQESISVSEIVTSKAVNLLMEAGINETALISPKLVTMSAKLGYKNVSVPVPCSR
mmetsp:Transcript_59344/g.105505  ORF Transcript_59344/g.105505 Transcript_59344/m.105505 type:complete len:992 (-) Transcript_59344:41-3016(-)